MMNWFKNCKSIEEAKELYKKLCRQHHPDLCEDANATEVMQQINEQFTRVFETLKNKHRTDAQQDNTAEQNTNGADTTTAAEFMEIINSLIHLDGITIDLVGRWIWLGGETFKHKDTIKKLGFMWANKKKMWYWHKAEDVCKSRKNLSIEEIKNKYGCQSFATVTTQRLTATA